MSALRIACLLAFVSALAGCKEPPGQTYHGVVASDAPLTMPLSGARACVGTLRETTRAPRNSTRARTTHGRGTPRYAPGATLRVRGERLRLVGERGAPTYGDVGRVYRWVFTGERAEVPEALRGWGQDHLIDAIERRPSMHTYSHVSFEEAFTLCGDRLSVRAIRDGDALMLVDTNPAETENALRFFGGLALGGLFCCGGPILLFGIFLFRRHARRAAAEARKAQS